MYKVLTIGGKDYKLEYSIEAALYKDGIDRLIEFISGTVGVQSEKEITKGLDSEKKALVIKQLVENLKNEVLGLPNTALEIFYMGLLEYHGQDGDSTILSRKDAKHLISQLFEEQSEDGIKDFATLLSVCMDQMGEDGFFKKMWLEKIAGQNADAKPNRAARRAALKQ